MFLPVITYGNPVLRSVCAPVDASYPDLESLINNMWDTLCQMNGCGLAAPQVCCPLKVLVVNSRDTYLCLSNRERKQYFDGDNGIREIFLNAEIIKYDEHAVWNEYEGCLSIPGISAAVKRPWSITVKYSDRSFNEHVKVFSGYTARIIQHEFDHTQGKLYIDRLEVHEKYRLINKLQNGRSASTCLSPKK
ncbi:MAG: peptide deformylase [Bacteroidales bacterium]|nr:peptide deformylase [Bacteroidales bacterium]